MELKGDNLKTLLNEWESCLIGLKTVPPQDILESLFRKQLERSESLKGMMTLLNMNVTQNGEVRSYEKLVSMLRTFLEDSRRRRNRDALTNQQGRSRATPATGEAPKKAPGDCHTFMKYGSCSRPDCPWNHPIAAARSGEPPGKGGKSRSNSPKGKGGKGKGKGGKGEQRQK